MKVPTCGGTFGEHSESNQEQRKSEFFFQDRVRSGLSIKQDHFI